MPRELGPLLGRAFAGAGKLLNARMQALAQSVIAEFDAVHGDNGKVRRNAMTLGKIKQSRHQLPPSQVARSAEDDEYVRCELIARFHCAQVFIQSV